MPHDEAKTTSPAAWEVVAIELIPLSALGGGPTVEPDAPEMVLVPREPSPAMIRAAHWALYHWREASGDPQREASRDEKHAIRWRAMIAAWSAENAA